MTFLSAPTQAFDLNTRLIDLYNRTVSTSVEVNVRIRVCKPFKKPSTTSFIIYFNVWILLTDWDRVLSISSVSDTPPKIVTSHYSHGTTNKRVNLIAPGMQRSLGMRSTSLSVIWILYNFNQFGQIEKILNPGSKKIGVTRDWRIHWNCTDCIGLRGTTSPWCIELATKHCRRDNDSFHWTKTQLPPFVD